MSACEECIIEASVRGPFADSGPCTHADLHAERREANRRERKVLDNRRSVFLRQRLSAEPQRRKALRKRGA